MGVRLIEGCWFAAQECHFCFSHFEPLQFGDKRQVAFSFTLLLNTDGVWRTHYLIDIEHPYQHVIRFGDPMLTC